MVFAGSLVLFKLPEEALPTDGDLKLPEVVAVPELAALPILHEALKVAPGSTANFDTATVPSITAEDFNDSRSFT